MLTSYIENKIKTKETTKPIVIRIPVPSIWEIRNTAPISEIKRDTK